MKKKAIFCWSGGKDSAYALWKAIESEKYDICYLLTTVHKQLQRVSMHGVSLTKIQEQAESIGIPLKTVFVEEGTNEEYERSMNTFLIACKNEGIDTVLFGDIFLEDLREYREMQLSKVAMNAEFPIWKLSTKDIVEDFIVQGFQTVLCCINDGVLDESFVGQLLTKDLLARLPHSVDPCGENGEYHTFCFDGPIFKKQINCNIGEKIYKKLELTGAHNAQLPPSNTKGFWYCNIL